MAGFGAAPFGLAPFGLGDVDRSPVPPRSGWRFLAQRITGDGEPGEWLDTDLPLTNVTVTDVLSGPPRISGRIDPAHRRLKGADGRPLLDEWGTVIYAEADGQIQGCGIYTSGRFNGPTWEIDCAGFTAYPKGMGYSGAAYSQTDVDPLDVVRHLWDTLQAGQDSDLGLSVDAATITPVRLGTGVDTDGLPQPYEINEWSTHDLGAVIDDLAKATPFDYRERHYWNPTRTEVLHELVFGHPRIGRRRRDLRFVLGENIHVQPAAARDGAGYASHVRFLGAGEGREMVRADSMLSTGRLRRMATVDDKSVDATEHAFRRAADELNRRLPLLEVTDAVITQPPGLVEPGDELRLQGSLDWIDDLDLWVRVVAVTVSPEEPSQVGVQLVRVGS